MRSLRFLASRTGSTLFALDVVLLAVVWPAALWLGHDTLGLAAPGRGEARIVLFPLANLLLLYAMGLYRRDAVLETRRSLTRLPLVVGLGGAAAVAAQLLLELPGLVPPTEAHAPLLLAAMVCFTGCAGASRVALYILLRKGVFRRRILVVGAGHRAAELMAMVHQEGSGWHYDCILVHDPAFGPREPTLGKARHQCVVEAADGDLLALARRHDVDQIVVAPDERRGMRLETLLDCKKNGYPVVQYLTFIEREARRVDLRWIELGWILYSDGFTYRGIDRALKRAFDVLVSGMILLLSSGFLVAAAIAIKCQDRGPVFYRQTRVTRDGQTFRILKLRTMRTDAERHGAVWAASGDQRVTRVGRFLRRSRIDEIPQLLNVLRGEMSLVGPRPERPEFTCDLTARIPLYNERHTVKAGLTGWAQINYPYGASIEDARAKLSYDLYYVKNFSILFDLLIIVQTLRVVLFPSGAR